MDQRAGATPSAAAAALVPLARDEVRVPAFDIGPAHLFANTGDLGGEDELAVRVFADRALATVLLRAGYVQIGMSVDGGFYDAVCFHTRLRRGGGEYPLVRVDHEAALVFDRISVVREVAPSFLHLIS